MTIYLETYAFDPPPKCVKARKQANRASALEADTSAETHQALWGCPDTITELA